jgi:hypothetical protein
MLLKEPLKCLFGFIFFAFLLTSNQGFSAENKKIALIFLTRNGVNHPNFWKKELSQHADKFNAYFYSDNPLIDPFYNNLRLQETVPTNWNCHIKTWQHILKEAFKNEENYKFVYLSESCLPLFSLNEIYKALTEDNNSYMCFAGPWWPNGDCRDVLWLPKEHRWGNSEWIILNRDHTETIIKDNFIIEIVSNFPIDSESYPATLFSVKRCLGEFVCRTTTYVDWAHPENGGAHPYHFREFSQYNLDVLVEAKKGKHFFARKFTASFPEEAIPQIINAEPNKL